ncbi:hypothetical protein OG949_38755 [Streptomyces scopuliridis]|uniref:hypothetical protein n=1 Tax=Streptomyces scopuliridis TaxID=452529 RepID=UPI002DD8E8C5|nr:hypothetical protein [Streptomyces scopuliridis]WSB38183.1 hypothetical protein OG949_38755 [Streptomyces scopuliridis]
MTARDARRDPAARDDGARLPWGTSREIDRAAARLARTRAWPALWALTCSVPVADAVRAARRLRLGRWSPPDQYGRALAERLAAQDPRMADRVTEDAWNDASRVFPEAIARAGQVSFAPGGGAMALLMCGDDEGEGEGERLALAGLPGTGLSRVYSGTRRHESVSCQGPRDLIALRRTGAVGNELVRYTPGTTQILADGTELSGGRTVATAHGFVVGLRTAPVVLTGTPAGPVERTDISPFGLGRGDLLAVGPTGGRLAFGDRARLVVTDARLSAVLAGSTLPGPHGEILDLAFAGPRRLITSGAHGGLWMWEPAAGRLLPVARTDAPRLSELFSVPALRVVGGRAVEEGRPYFFDSTDLSAVPMPAALTGAAGQWATASPDGRYIVRAGRSRGDAPPGQRSARSATRVHDLRHPSATLRLPLAALTPDDVRALGALLQAPPPGPAPARRPLLELVRDCAAYVLDGHVRWSGPL